MDNKPKRGRKPLSDGKKREIVRFSIKREIIEKYGIENLLRPEIIVENDN